MFSSVVQRVKRQMSLKRWTQIGVLLAAVALLATSVLDFESLGVSGGDAPSAQPRPVPAPTTDDIASELSELLDEESLASLDDEIQGVLRSIVDASIEAGDFEAAIAAASEIPNDRDRAAALIAVARGAIEARLYDCADAAADEIPYDSERDAVKIEISVFRLEHEALTPTVTPTSVPAQTP